MCPSFCSIAKPGAVEEVVGGRTAGGTADCFLAHLALATCEASYALLNTPASSAADAVTAAMAATETVNPLHQLRDVNGRWMRKWHTSSSDSEPLSDSLAKSKPLPLAAGSVLATLRVLFAFEVRAAEAPRSACRCLRNRSHSARVSSYARSAAAAPQNMAHCRLAGTLKTQQTCTN